MFCLLIFILSGCDNLNSKTKKKQHDKNNQLTIGLVSLMTGSHAVYGKNVHNGVMLALEEINHSGGINGRPIEIILEDEGADPKGASNAVQKLITIHNVPVIIGPASSSGVMAAAPIANQKEVVLLSPGAASPNISNAGEYIFRNRASGSAESRAIADFAVNYLHLKKIVILQITTDYGSGFKSIFEQDFKLLGGEIIAIEYFNSGASDFRSQITKLKSLNPEGIYIIGVPIEVGNILKQCKEIAFKPIVLTNNMESDELLKIAGDAANGIYFAIPAYNPESEDILTKSFNEKFRKKYGYNSDMFAANGYDAVNIIVKCIKEKGYSGPLIKEALYTLKFSVVNGGNIRFDSNGDVIKPLIIKTVIDNQFKIVNPK